MTNEKYKRRTIRLTPFVDNELNIIASKNKITVNKLVADIIMAHISELDKINNENNVTTILNSLESMTSEINDIQKKCNWLSSLTKQIFINSGFAKNRTAEEDNAFKEFLSKRYREKYETNYDA